MLTPLCRASTIPVKLAAMRATPAERTPMTSISWTTSRTYLGGSARFRATCPVRRPRPPYHATVLRRYPALGMRVAYGRRRRRTKGSKSGRPRKLPPSSGVPAHPTTPAPTHAARSARRAGVAPIKAALGALGPRVGRCPPRVTASELLEHLSQRNPPRPEQHDRVEPEIGHLLDEAPVALAAEGRRHHLHRLLADLAADRRLARGQEPADVGAGRRPALPRLDDGLEPGQHVRPSFRGPVLTARRQRTA